MRILRTGLMVLDKALALKPLHVLPGHGAAGGPEILTGQASFCGIFIARSRLQADAGKTPAEMQIKLPEQRQQLGSESA